MKQLYIYLAFLLPLYIMAQPTINTITPASNSVELNDKFEARIELAAAYQNPYDYDQITVKAVFTGPNNQRLEVDGFFQDYFTQNTAGSLIPDGNGFTVRFSPHKKGNWTCEVTVTDSTGTSNPRSLQFDCVAFTNPKNNGFVRTGASNYLQFDDGDQYIPIGENICWQNGNAFSDYSTWLGELAANGGNFFRLWHAHWGLGIEWKDGWRSFQGLRKYKQTNCFYQDWMFDYCADNGLYVMLALQHHGPVSTQVNPNWNDNPYNVANGGPCNNTSQFFTNADAIAHTKNRYRYIIARWGYARSIMAWELFNEVEWTDNYSSNAVKVIDWHAEMAAYLKQVDPYKHLVTTSYAHDDKEAMVWANTDIDLTQTHYYINSPNIERVLKGGIVNYLDMYQKPTLTGEFGLGLSSTLSAVDPDGIHIHNAMWGSLFGGGMGSAMSWWWDIYIHPQDLYYHFDPLAKVKGQIGFVKQEMRPTQGLVTGASGDLSFSPGGGWGVIGEDSIFIDRDGVFVPANPTLGRFLYGSQWNTQFRSPPVFSVDYPTVGAFSVRTSTTTGNSPEITIWLDGMLLLQQNAAIGTTYSVNIPAGKHIIKVDNSGTDWISISAYTFEGLGSTVDPYVLISTDQKTAAGWLLNNQYNHLTIPVGGVPAPAVGAEFSLQGFHDSTYYVKWFDCITGAMVNSQQIVVSGGELTFPIPDLYWDLAFIVDSEEPIVASLDHEVRSLDFQVYPNPAIAGGIVKFSLAQAEKVSILNMSGQEVMKVIDFQDELQLASNLAPGFYWVKVESAGMAGAKPLLVQP